MTVLCVSVPTSPRKVSGSSPRRSRIAANAPSTSISKIAYHRPTPANHTGSAIPATHLSAVVSTHARLTDAAPSAAAPRDARVRKRLERILIDSSACRAPSPTVSGGSKSQSVSYRYADAVDEADKENASVVRASAALDDSVSPLQPPQPQPAQSTRSRLVRRAFLPFSPLSLQLVLPLTKFFVYISQACLCRMSRIAHCRASQRRSASHPL